MIAKSFKLSTLGMALFALGSSAQAVEFKAGDTTVNVGGIVNTYYTYADCSGADFGLAGRSFSCGGNTSSTTIGNGLLPNYLAVSTKTTAGGIDIGATIGIGSAAATSSQIANNFNVDVRQGFGTFGTASAGTIKFGRDYGYFGKNAILGDITLLGVGIADRATQNGRVSLGHIGAGYTYLGTYGMISYTTPDLSGFSGTFALVNPVDDGGPADDSPQIQVLLEYKITNLGKVWAAAKHQKFATTPSFETQGFEIGGSFSIAGFGFLANYQTGDALGLLADGDSGDQDQDNYLIQATYNFTPAFKFGVNYGQNKFKDGGISLLGSTKESNWTAGVYYNLAGGLTLVGEISETKSEVSGSSDAKLKGISLGAILFF